MGKFYFDTEFLEGIQGRSKKPTIDLISIGIVSEDGRTYYAISKDFNLKEAWNRWQSWDIPKYAGKEKKDYWIRNNVLRPIYDELLSKRNDYEKTYYPHLCEPFSYKNMKRLIKRHGKTNEQIASEIKNFVYSAYLPNISEINVQTWKGYKQELLDRMQKDPITFYAYFADYDWTVFCWLFGKMITLPTGFPMYCRDLKQMLDEKLEDLSNSDFFTKFHIKAEMTLKEKLVEIKKHTEYPTQENEHNALDDAKWNKDLYDFIQKLIPSLGTNDEK